MFCGFLMVRECLRFPPVWDSLQCLFQLYVYRFQMLVFQGLTFSWACLLKLHDQMWVVWLICVQFTRFVTCVLCKLHCCMWFLAMLQVSDFDCGLGLCFQVDMLVVWMLCTYVFSFPASYLDLFAIVGQCIVCCLFYRHVWDWYLNYYYILGMLGCVMSLLLNGKQV